MTLKKLTFLFLLILGIGDISAQNLDSLLFMAAMDDAVNPEPTEVYNGLLRISGNDDLIDTMIDKERYVLMVSWKSHPEYYPQKGKYNTGEYDIWVTAAPSIQEMCKIFYKTEKNLDLRLRQLLGLRPDTEETIFLQLWVKPDDLFRPCPDKETSDTKCDLSFPPDVSDEHRRWFNDLRAVQYIDCNDTHYSELGYPWTQLGYTYDWNLNNVRHIGLSEFVINQNADVYVRAETPTSDYCGGN